MDLEFGEEWMFVFGEGEGSTEFGWMRGSVRGEQIQDKGITKGGKKGKSEVSERVGGEDWNGT